MIHWEGHDKSTSYLRFVSKASKPLRYSALVTYLVLSRTLSICFSSATFLVKAGMKSVSKLSGELAIGRKEEEGSFHVYLFILLIF